MFEPDHDDVTRCRGRRCRVAIIWVPTMAGKAMPLDAKPDPEGNVAIETDLLGEHYAQVLNDTGIREAKRRDVALYMPHHASCPDVEEFRHA